MKLTKYRVTFVLDPSPFTVSWENGEALRKHLPGVEVEYNHDHSHFILSVKDENDIVVDDLPQLATMWFAEVKQEIRRKQEQVKSQVLAWKPPVLPPTTKQTERLERVIARRCKFVKDNISVEDWDGASCNASDADDLAKLLEAVAAKDRVLARQLADSMDTAVRDEIPENVWVWIQD
jgi:hypothetical protein